MSTRTIAKTAKDTVTAEQKVAAGVVKDELSPFERVLEEMAKELEVLVKGDEKPKLKNYKKADLMRHDEAFIVLPNGMSLKQAREFLDKFEKDEMTDVGIHIDFPAFPLDGVRAFMRALKAIYGFSQTVPVPSWFGSEPPMLINIPVSATEVEPIYWGRFRVPNLDGYLDTSFDSEEGGVPHFVLHGEVKKKDEYKVQRIAQMVSFILQNDSIYKGKAIKLDLTWMRNRQSFNPNYHAPKFMNLHGPQEPLILNRAAETGLMTTLFHRLQNPEACLANGIPLKTGIMLAGEPGTGKSLTALKIAQACEMTGWAFLYVTDARDASKAFSFAELVGDKAVIFIEDIDKVLERRDLSMNELLNLLDGVEKQRQIIVVFTTNDLHKIEKVAVRPGRIDLIVELGEVDDYAAEKFLHAYAVGTGGVSTLDDSRDYSAVIQQLVGMRPAYISNAVTNAKIDAMIKRSAVTPEILLDQIAAKKHHMAVVERMGQQPEPDTLALLLEQIAEKVDVKNSVTDIINRTKLMARNGEQLKVYGE